MKNNIKYNVTLSNRSCIFDACDGFDSLEEALDWVSGRGGSYGVELTKEISGVEQYPDITLRATHRGHKTTFAVNEITHWRNVTIKQIADMI